MDAMPLKDALELIARETSGSRRVTKKALLESIGYGVSARSHRRPRHVASSEKGGRLSARLRQCLAERIRNETRNEENLGF